MTFFAYPLVRALGWALLHFIWQGALIAVLLAALLSLLRKCSANARYLGACCAMLLMLGAPAVTVYQLLGSGPANEVAGQRLVTQRVWNETFRAPAGTGDWSAQLELRSRPDGATPTRIASYRQWLERQLAIALPYVLVVWLGGVIFLAVRLLGGWAVTRRLRREGLLPSAPLWQETVDRLARQIRVSRPVRLCVSAFVRVPTVIGWLRPVILVPASVLTGLSPQQLRALLMHELAHVRRHDYLVNLLQAIAETLLFYHPAVWWVSGRVRAEREHACDDIAVATCGDALVYARALTLVEELRGARASGIMAVAADGSSLLGRIRRLVAPPPAAPRRAAGLTGFVVSAALLSIAVAAGYAARRAQMTAAPEDAPHRRQVAVTFVSLPPLQLGGADFAESEDILRRIVERLTAHRIPAVGFVGEKRVQVPGQEERRSALLRMWLDAGLELGNQTFSHPKLYNTPVAEFEQDVIRGEQVTRRLMEERGMRLRYFSYPYLNTGRDRESKAAVENFLRGRGYSIHQVTIDSDEWEYSAAYAEAKARGDRERMRSLRDDYVTYMERMFEFFEGMSRELEGREIPQVLMLTASALNADAFDDLVRMMERRGYAFVSLERAMNDKAYGQPNTYLSSYGYSWLQQWAVTRGGVERREPETPFIEAFERNWRAGAGNSRQN